MRPTQPNQEEQDPGRQPGQARSARPKLRGLSDPVSPTPRSSKTPVYLQSGRPPTTCSASTSGWARSFFIACLRLVQQPPPARVRAAQRGAPRTSSGSSRSTPTCWATSQVAEKGHPRAQQRQGAVCDVRGRDRGAGRGAGTGGRRCRREQLREHVDSKLLHNTRIGRRGRNRLGAPTRSAARRASRSCCAAPSGTAGPTWWCRRPTATPGGTTFFVCTRGPLGNVRDGSWRGSQGDAPSTTCRARSRPAPPATARWSARSRPTSPALPR